ncbi:cellulose biosynthesis cyclic di-GMP-binding regulatory protein BcsB [Burkholderia paludis]|uniref:cellulose biosynthesis cyclic di-GMP-binding regulatory protein BcsB n=1 Tax=Burkholderia paludis TaxID=1506587 RepID=UPI001F230508|nr:cellulose biosynthesis cyclic di-GMP-binding regulatory protein BcsB [Burkholderia paludis]
MPVRESAGGWTRWRARVRRMVVPLACWMIWQAGAVPLAQAVEAAQAVGDVPPPSPAVPFFPEAGRQPALAGSAPVLSADQQRLLGVRRPTTANPGTLLPGGRRQGLTFADFGALDPLQLRGTEGQNGVSFAVRNDEIVTGAVLHLVYSYSPALLPELSQLKVLVNGEVAATLPLPQAQAGTTVSRDIPIDPRFITEYNHLNLQLIGHYTRRCEDPSNSSLWATVSNASTLDLTYASLPAKADLGALPAPFFDRRDVRRLELPFVFAAQPGRETVEAAGIVSSWFGALAGYRGALFPASVGQVPPSGNAVVFATPDDRVDGVALPRIDGPTVAVVPRDAPARGQVLLVLGRNAAELRTAATALVLGKNALSGSSAAVGQLSGVAPRVPYDAPNWLSSTRPVRLGELLDERALSVTGYDGDAVRVNLRVPPDLFMWNTRGAPLDLRYRYTVRPFPDRSSLNVSVGDTFVKSLPIPARDASRFSLGHYLQRIAADGTGAERYRVDVPPPLLTPRAQLRLHFYYDIPNTGECAGRLLQNVQGAIDPDSTIDVSSFPHYKAMPDLAAFANSGFPFTRMADLSGTAVVLPDDPGAGVYGLFLLEMGRMGASTGYPVTGVSVTDAAGVDALADKDLLILGAPGKQPLLKRFAKAMPFSGDGERSTFALTDLVFRVKDAWRGAQETEPTPTRADLSLVSDQENALIAGFESPLHAARSAVALVSMAGRSDEDLTSALLDADILPAIQGGMAVIHGRSVTVTSNGDIYHVGSLPPIAYVRWVLSAHPLLLLFGGLFAALVIAALFYRLLRSVAARRLKE